MIRCRLVKPYSNRRAADILDHLQVQIMPEDFKCEYKINDRWWIVFDDELPIAYACVRPLALLPSYWYLARAGVLLEFRGRGLQKKLIRLRCNAARRAGATHVVTDTHRTNHPSSNSLIACGFKLYTPQDKWSFETGLYWMKEL